STVAVKKVNDVTRLQALVNKKKVVVTEATIIDALLLEDADGVECLPNEEILTKLARMGVAVVDFNAAVDEQSIPSPTPPTPPPQPSQDIPSTS
nr:hypothetical protein [Tanacetum cinerariifolium]